MEPFDLQYYLDGIRARNRRIIAKAITLVESALPAHQARAREILAQLLPHGQNAIRLGITGVPGVGKSVFIENLGMMLIRKGQRVAVLAVDPSSQKSGGSVMADKTRMEKLSLEENAFIRPSPSKGALGGVAGKTREAMIICEAAGFDVVIIETIGVGQSETAVAAMVDFFLLLLLAGAGDEFQGIKKGILELADALVVTKADGENKERAQQAKRTYEAALGLFSPAASRWQPPVLTCSALEMIGIDKVWDTVLEHRQELERSGELQAKRRSQAREWMLSLLEEGLKNRFFQNPEIKDILPAATREVEEGLTTPAAAADRLLKLLDG